MTFSVRFSKSNYLLDTKLAINQNMICVGSGFQNQKDMSIDAEFADFQRVSVFEKAEYYEGDYQITPRVEEQTMKTAQKMMTDDVTIQEIPYYETSHTSGGATVYIGKEVEIYGN